MEKNKFNKKINNITMEPTYTFLTTKELLMRKFVDCVPFGKKQSVESSQIIVPGYSLLKNLTVLSSGTSALIGIFMKNETKEKVFIKKYVFECKGLRYGSLINELGILTLLNKYNLFTIKEDNFVIPALKRVIRKETEITILCEYKEGTKLLDFDSKTKISAIKKILDAMHVINKTIINEIPKLPHRRTYILAGSFFYFWLKYTFKESHNIKKSISYLISFYKNYLATIQEKNIYGLIHRDLHSRNILLDKEDIIITDWEGAVVTDYLYDLVMITRLYMKELTLEERIKLLRAELKTTAQKKRFMYLTLFYSIQTLGVDKKKDLSYIHTKEYLDEFENHIIPALFTN